MSNMILLGAGASAEAGVPTSYKMSRVIVDKFREDRYLTKQAQAISFVAGGLLFQQGVRNQNPFDGVDVEELFNAVMLLAQRDNLEAAPFISAWHPFIDEMDRISNPQASMDRLGRIIYTSVTQTMMKAFPSFGPAFKADGIDKAIGEAIKNAIDAAQRGRSLPYSGYPVHAGRKIEEWLRAFIKDWGDNVKSHVPSFTEMETELKRILEQEKDKPGEGMIFMDVAQAMVSMLADIVWIEDSNKVEYLQPILNYLAHEGRLTIATLNYDNSIELMAATNGVGVESGLEHWSATGNFTPPEKGLFLLKLHGAIDWIYEPNPTSPGSPMPQCGIRRGAIAEVRRSGLRPAVIFGQKNKLTADGPFLDLLRAFKAELSQANRLTVIGYSFRDDHINTMISQWLNQSPDNRICIVDPGFEQSTVPYAQDLKGHARARLDVIPQYASEGVNTLFSKYPEGPTFNMLGDVQDPASPSLFDVPQVEQAESEGSEPPSSEER